MTQVLPLGETIRRARRAKGWTQQDLAVATGIGLRSIASYEAGESAPRWDKMQALERELGPLLTPLDGDATIAAVEAAIRDLLARIDPDVRRDVMTRLARDV